jgi:hypothetical protein
MSGEATTSAGGGSPHPAEPAQGPGQGRPWSPAAAMDPVPPLAPPPARPGDGTPVPTTERVPAVSARLRAAVIVAALVLVVVVLLLATGVGH